MKLNEVMKKTGLTKKAIYYYEEEGLVSPIKEEENGYRTYSEQDIGTLMTIQLLRKLDIPTSDIKSMMVSDGTLAHAAAIQLNRMEREMERLQANKDVLRRLAGLKNGLTVEEMRKMLADLNEKSKNTAGYLMKELDRILPGNLGKLFAIHYGQFLDQPLDTMEKEKAWQGLLGYLDDCVEIQYPETIKRIVDSLYQNLGDKELEGMVEKARSVTDSLLSRKTEVPEAVRTEIFEKIQAYQKTEEYKDFVTFQEFVKDNLAEIFQGVDQYMRVISDKFDRLQKLFENAAGSGTI